MTAEIVSIGTELLFGQIADTDAQVLGRLFPELGIEHRHRQTVGDNRERVVAALRFALSRSEIVVTIGGLGPTEDDLTRQAIAEAMDAPLELDEHYARALRKRFAVSNVQWVDSQLNQAMVPRGGQKIDNPNGTAPGLFLEKNGKIIIAMPGPRSEFVPMAHGPVRDLLAERSTGQRIVTRSLKVVGLGEGVVEDRLRDLLASANPTLAPYASPGEVHLRLAAKADSHDAATVLLEPLEQAVRDRLGRAIFGADQDTLDSVNLEILRGRYQTLAVAESCTGGGLGARLTAIPGASDVFLGGVISYTNAIKTELLYVPEDLLKRHGAVSSECAEAMASGARSRLGADWALAITGIAGPGGSTESKPVGLVYTACAGPNGVKVAENRFRGTREFIRIRSAQAALTMLWNELA